MEIGFVYPGWISARSEIARTDDAAIAHHMSDLSEQLGKHSILKQLLFRFSKECGQVRYCPSPANREPFQVKMDCLVYWFLRCKSRGITPQIEGLLEEDKLLAKLQELFPHDKFEHPGKGGDILQFVIEQGQQIGIIVYECKKVKNFDKKHIDQAKTARRMRGADFAVLVTNVFPSKKQYYFVEKAVFVISPISLEPITQTLRDSLVRIYMLRLSNEAKSKAVQQVYDYLSSNEYSNKVNDLASQLMDLGKELKTEITSHKRVWEKRYKTYQNLYIDIGVIDHKLRTLIKGLPGSKTLQLPAPPKQFIDIEELQG